MVVLCSNIIIDVIHSIVILCNVSVMYTVLFFNTPGDYSLKNQFYLLRCLSTFNCIGTNYLLP